MDTMEYGCIGERLAHSFSKEIHNALAPYDYTLCEVAREDLDAFMTARDFKAINVTIPYKEAVIPYLQEMDEGARQIGAVNTIVHREGKLYGYNTDFMGMDALARRIGMDFSGKKVLVLGTGGTAKTAVAVAKSRGAGEIITVSRTKGVTYDDARRQHSDARIMINTTPCGMYPDNDSAPVDLADYPCLEAVLDVVYNPLVTRLIADAKKRGIPAEGGLYMLVAQAVFASEKFIDTAYDPTVLDTVFHRVLLSKQNIVLTGMPSCGKTTVGRRLAEMTGREFVDTDQWIVQRYGAITDIFETHGEECFRRMETEAIREISRRCGCVIATGGGAILRSENVDALRSNGRIVFIDRPPELLTPTADRPLSKDLQAIRARYTERYGLYTGTADLVVDGSATPDEVAQSIQEAWG